MIAMTKKGRGSDGRDWQEEIYRQRAMLIRHERIERARGLIKLSEIRELHLRLINLFRAVQRDAAKRLAPEDAAMMAEIFDEKLDDIRRLIDDFGVPPKPNRHGRGPDKKPRTRRYGIRSCRKR